MKSSRTPVRNSRYLSEPYPKVTRDSTSTYRRDPYPETVYDSLRINIFMSEPINSCQAIFNKKKQILISPWVFLFLRTHFHGYHEPVCPKLQFLGYQMKSSLICSLLYCSFCLTPYLWLLASQTQPWHLKSFLCFKFVQSLSDKNLQG